MKAARKLIRRQQPQASLDSVRPFLTPLVCKQARPAGPRHRPHPRWDLQPLVLIATAMTWASGASQAEKFETAGGSYVASYATRKRPGMTLQGSQKALSRIPWRPLKALAARVRPQIRLRDARRLLIEGFEPRGCDGSRLECPRGRQLEARLGQAGQADAAPTVWVRAFVHLATGPLRSWQLGPGTAAEQDHLRRLLGTLSSRARIVCDAADLGSDLVLAIVGSGRSLLSRMSSKVALYPPEEASLKDGSEGPVLSWPKYVPRKGRAPVRCRLIRVPARGKAKHDVWLLTDVLDPARLSAAPGSRSDRWRWRDGGGFRMSKRTITERKLSSRTVRLAQREAEVSLLATELLLAHADLALRPETSSVGEPVISPRQVQIEIRREMRETGERRDRSRSDRRGLQDSRADDREPRSPKAWRPWPRRKPHKPPKPPKLHTLTEEQKVL